MSVPVLRSHAEQLAEYLRQELDHGRWRGCIPGVLRLERELGVNRNTIEAALQLLEKEGVLIPRGVGKRRQIAANPSVFSRPIRIAILQHSVENQGLAYMIDLMGRLKSAGHLPFFAEKSLLDLGMDVEKVSSFVDQAQADAWVVMAGSVHVLQWFADQPYPVFALFGRRRRLAIAGAGPDKVPALRSATSRLIELGHRRIVLLAREERRLPVPGILEQAFLNELKTHGIATGRYNLPAWQESSDGLHDYLNSVLQLTPPTAIITDEAPFFTAVMQHLSRHGMRVPEDISLICCDSDPNFEWCQPPITHIRWDPVPVIRKILRWADQIRLHKEDIRQSHIRAEFVEGGTIGPVRK